MPLAQPKQHKNRTRKFRTFLSDFRVLPSIIAVGLFIIAIYIDHLTQQNYLQEQRLMIGQQASTTKAKLEGNINNNIQAILALIAAVKSEPKMDQNRYSQLAKHLFNEDNQLKIIAIAPDLIISNTYPLKGNEKTIGFDYRTNKQQLPGVLLAKETKKMILAGPINLIQGGLGFIVRIPIFLPQSPNDFWGVASAVIDAEAFFEESGLHDEDLGIDIAIQGFNGQLGEDRVFFGNPDIVKQQPVSSNIELPYGHWKVYITPKSGWSTIPPDIFYKRAALVFVLVFILLPIFYSSWLNRKQKSESERLKNLFSISPVGIVLNDYKTGRFINCNDTFLQNTQFTLDELKNKAFRDLTPKKYFEQDSANIQKLIKDGGYGPYEKEVLTKNGHAYPAVLNGILSADENGKPYVWSFIIDITENKNAQKKILLQNQTLELVIDSTLVGIWDWNIQTGALILNERWAEIIGYTLDELSPISIDTWMKYAYPDDLEESNRRLNECWEAPGRSYIYEARMRHKDGSLRWVLDSGKVVEWADDGSPIRMVGTHLDITEQKEIQDSLEIALEKSKIAAKTKSDFLATMSHEIRTPMNGILGMLELLDKSQLDTEQSRKVNIAQSSANSLLTIIDDILDFSKMDAGKLAIESIDFNLRAIIDSCVESLCVKAYEKDLAIIIDNIDIDSIYVKGDPNRVRQIFMNILGNAIKFTHDGEVSITSKLITKNNVILFECQILDTGIGIPSDKIHDLFSSFSQVDASTTRQYGGTGLGLSISKKLARLMNGDITVNSQLHSGSQFTITLQFEPAKNLDTFHQLANLDHLHILVFDENKTGLNTLSRQLESWGAKVQSCKDVKECENSLSKHQFDFIFVNNCQADSTPLTSHTSATRIHISQLDAQTAKNKSDNFDVFFQAPLTTENLLSCFNQTMLNKPSDHVVEHTNSIKGAHILLVEDIPFNQEVACLMLDELGVTAHIAENGKDALTKLKDSQKYDLILMDCQMPEMDGFEATRKIRSGAAGNQFTQVPIIALTANAMASDKEQCLAAGMTDYLSKPIDILKLESMLNKHLANT